MTDDKNPVPPKDLSAESSAWWKDVIETYELQPHHIKLLTLACRTWDRAEEARAALREHGLTYLDGHKVKRPAPGGHNREKLRDNFRPFAARIALGRPAGRL